MPGPYYAINQRDLDTLRSIQRERATVSNLPQVGVPQPRLRRANRRTPHSGHGIVDSFIPAAKYDTECCKVLPGKGFIKPLEKSCKVDDSWYILVEDVDECDSPDDAVMIGDKLYCPSSERQTGSVQLCLPGDAECFHPKDVQCPKEVYNFGCMPLTQGQLVTYEARSGINVVEAVNPVTNANVSPVSPIPDGATGDVIVNLNGTNVTMQGTAIGGDKDPSMSYLAHLGPGCKWLIDCCETKGCEGCPCCECDGPLQQRTITISGFEFCTTSSSASDAPGGCTPTSLTSYTQPFQFILDFGDFCVANDAVRIVTDPVRPADIAAAIFFQDGGSISSLSNSDCERVEIDGCHAIIDVSISQVFWHCIPRDPPFVGGVTYRVRRRSAVKFYAALPDGFDCKSGDYNALSWSPTPVCCHLDLLERTADGQSVVAAAPYTLDSSDCDEGGWEQLKTVGTISIT